MSKWPIPAKRNEEQVFLAFANYAQRFIINDSAKACPLIDLTKDVAFICKHTQLLQESCILLYKLVGVGSYWGRICESR